MLIFDGTYRLERDEDPGIKPVHACAWRVKVIDFSLSGASVYAYIRPYALLAVRKQGGIFKTSCAESLGKRICRDFNLRVDKVLWVEVFADLPKSLYVAVFTPRHKGEEVNYSISWRPIIENEQRAIDFWNEWE